MTPGAWRVLRELHDDEEIDLARERGTVFIGNRQTTTRVLDELLELTAIKCTYRDGIPDGGYSTYGINETGEALLRRPALEQELRRRLFSRRRTPFTIIGDRIRPLSWLMRAAAEH